MKLNIPSDIAELYERAKAQLDAVLPPQSETDSQQALRNELLIYQLALELQHEEIVTCARLLDNSQEIGKIGSVEMDPASRTIIWSAESYRIHETSSEEFDPVLYENLDYYLPESRQLISNALKAAIEKGQVFDLELEKLTMKGRKIDLRTTCKLTYQNGKPRFTGIYQDITERKQAERRQQHHNRVLEMLIEKTPLAKVLETIVHDVESINPGMICSILLLDTDGKHLRHGAAPSLPAFYVDAINGEPIGMGLGSCGTAAFTGDLAIVEDISTHPWWEDYREMALKANLASCWSQPIRSAQGKVLGTFAIYHRTPAMPSEADILLIESEAQLASVSIEKTRADARLQLAASVFTHAREGIIITDFRGNIIDVNDTFSHITGYNRNEVIGTSPGFLRSEMHDPEFYRDLWHNLHDKGHWNGEIWNKRKNGETYAEMMTISAVCDNEGKIINFVSLFTDITPLKQHQQQLEHIAHYDALTNLPNRILLADRLKQAILQSHRTSNSLAVLYIDLDGFKAVNDNHGHDTGDQLLVTLTNRLKEALREGDTLARIGGDEFIVVLTDLQQSNDYQPVLKRLLQAAAEPIAIKEHLLNVSASIGVTLYPQDGGDADQLLRHADQAMYLAKQAGKNCYHLFDVAQDVAVKSQRESLEHIRHAFERNEFVLYYQPKVNMKTGEVIGAEALIRWQHPERGLLAPAAFLPIIEDHPISVELGEWVIATALKQISDWHKLGLKIPISVNVGALQLQRGDFSQRLAHLLANQTEVQPNYLELEIVETSALADIAEVAEHMRACNELGVRFSVDDFGTGYSSLTYLKRLPAETLKIDQSFVRDMLDDPDDLAIVKGVIGLASAFHRKVIAEGVETIDHGERLLELGCDLAQGYGIARPMPAAALPDWAKAWSSSPGFPILLCNL